MDLVIANITIFDGVMKAALQVAMGALNADQAIAHISDPKFDADEILKSSASMNNAITPESHFVRESR